VVGFALLAVIHVFGFLFAGGPINRRRRRL
jgi:hypothetical protein